MISVILPLGEYTKKLDLCLDSLNGSTVKDFEVIVVYQGKDDQIQRRISFPKDKIQIIKIDKQNLCRAYNTGAAFAKGEILAYLSDDCYVDKNWLDQITLSFRKKGVYCVTGNTFPYPKTRNGPDQVCYCAFNSSRFSVITKPCSHNKYIGYSNNFAITKKYFFNIGGFREIFSPGQFGIHACDADLFLRILIDKKPIIHNPKMILQHDHWQSGEEAMNKEMQYVGGDIACYGLYFWKGYSVGRELLYDNFVLFPLQSLKRSLVCLLQGKPKKSIAEIYYLLKQSALRITAFCRSWLIFITGH